MIHLPFSIGISPTLHIRGLIATERIKKNAIIERCPVILVPMQEEPFLKQTVLWKYYYEWNKQNHVIVLGYGSLINHSYTPNARYSFHYKDTELVFKALQDIAVGEEITVNYNYHPNNQEPLKEELLDYNKHFQYPGKKV